MQLHNTGAGACVEHVSTQATGRYVYTNISIAAVVDLPKISCCASRGEEKPRVASSNCLSLFFIIILIAFNGIFGLPKMTNLLLFDCFCNYCFGIRGFKIQKILPLRQKMGYWCST